MPADENKTPVMVNLELEELRLLLREESELAAQRAVSMTLSELGLDGLTKEQVAQIKSIADFVGVVKKESIKSAASFVTKVVLVLLITGAAIKFNLVEFFKS